MTEGALKLLIETFVRLVTLPHQSAFPFRKIFFNLRILTVGSSKTMHNKLYHGTALVQRKTLSMFVFIVKIYMYGCPATSLLVLIKQTLRSKQTQNSYYKRFVFLLIRFLVLHNGIIECCFLNKQSG